MAKLTAAEVDKIVEFKGTSPVLKSRDLLVLIIGLDAIDKAKAKNLAQKHAEEALNKSGEY
jgi:hypothetical protein